MRRLWLLLATVLTVDLTATGVGRAELEADPPAFNAGEVHAGAALAHRFPLVNRGSETLEIADIRPSCGCVTATPDRRRFAPGESGSLLLEVNTLTQPDGPTSWRAMVRWRCGDRLGETPVVLAARIQTDIVLEPTALVLTTDGAVDREATLTDRRIKPLTVLKAETTSERIKARVNEPRRGADGRWTWIIHLEAPADLPVGRHDEALHLYTSDPEYPDLKLPFTVVKRSRLRVSAAPAAVELTAGDGSPSRLVLLHGGDGDEVEIGGVDSDAAAVTCQWATGPRPTAAVRVRLDPAKLSPEGLKTMVHIRLVKPAAQIVDVPVTVAPR
jgi:Protein of unknown function (DUF1573)